MSASVNVGILKAAAVFGVCFKFKANLKILCPLSFILRWRKLTYFWTFFLLSQWMIFGMQINQKDSFPTQELFHSVLSPPSAVHVVNLIHLGFKMQLLNDLEELRMCFGLSVIILVYFKTKKSQADDLVYGEVLHSWN